jgi:hypothetical protein
MHLRSQKTLKAREGKVSHDGIVKAFLDTLGFDGSKSILTIGGTDVAFHCDKFNTRILKNIEDVMGYEEGSLLLKKWASQTTYAAFRKFLSEGSGSAGFSTLDAKGKLEAQLEMFKVLAYGAVRITKFNAESCVFSSRTSYLAEGWLENKAAWGWGLRMGPACHDMCGHLSAAMSLAFGKPEGAYVVQETACRTMGADECVFEAEGAGR